MRIGPYRAHFTAYQPRVRAAQEFCGDLPVAAEAIFVLDFIDPELRNLQIDFRVVDDRDGIGERLAHPHAADRAAIETATLFHEPARPYPRGHLTAHLKFTTAGDFVGVVTASADATHGEYAAVFPFTVGAARGWARLQWIFVVLGGGIVAYVVFVRARAQVSMSDSPGT